MVLAAGCGPSVVLPDGGGGGTGVGGSSAGDDAVGAEDEDGPDDGADSSGAVESGGGDDACASTPSVRATHDYAGNAARTVGTDLLRLDDGTLLMAGSMADESSVGQWIARTTDSGGVLWEIFERQEPGGNLRSAPVVNDLVWHDDRLHYAGWSDETGVVGVADLYGDHEEAGSPPELAGLYLRGIASSSAGASFLVGRASIEGAILRRDGAAVSWQVGGQDGSTAIAQANAVLAVDAGLFVVGRREGLPWLGRFDAGTGAEDVSAIADSGTTFEAESGEFQAVALGDNRIVAVGSIRHDKPQPDGSAGSFNFSEAFARAWTLDGEELWTWQPGPSTIRPGALHAVTVGADGVVYFAGVDAEFQETDRPLIGAVGNDGTLLWSLPAEALGEEFDYVIGTGIALGEPGQLFVLGSSQRLGEETTVLIELCY